MTTIRRRLLAMLLPALALLMLVGGLVDYWVAIATTSRAYDRALASTALALEASIRVDNRQIRFERPSTFDSTPFGTDAIYFITGPGHEWIAGARPAPNVPATVPGTVAHVTFWDFDFQGRHWRAATALTRTSEGPVQISIAETTERRARTQRVMLLGKLAVDFVELDITLLLIWLAVYYGLRPLDRLTQQVEQHTSLQMQRLELDRVPGELRPVIAAFNQVLELLQEAAQAQQRFVADAAHQMRTPVAGLLAQIELLMKEPRAAAISSQLGALQHGIQQLARSANQMLALARAEPVSGVHDKFEAVALKPLVELLVERHIERADQAGIDLGADAHEATMAGNAWLLEDLLENLIDNALKYTQSGGHVTVRCGTQDQHAYLEVEDDGPGIPESERQRVRERFYRRPGSTGIGCGLGLAIVDQIARAHDADFTIGTGSQGRGTSMRVRLRRAK